MQKSITKEKEIIKESEVKLVPLTRDFMFKRVFSLNQDLLKKFLISVLKLDLNPDNVNLELQSNELVKAKDREYHKTVDILVTFSNKVKESFLTIDVELNSQRPKDINFRNYLYINKIVTDKVERGHEANDYEQYLFIQLNLNLHKFSDNVGEKVYSIKEDNTNEEFVSNVKFISKALDYYYKIYYTNNEIATDDVVWLALLNSKDFKELEEMSDLVMSKKEKEKFIKTCKEASQDELILSEWEADKLAEMVKHTTIENAKKDGISEGREEGIKEGREEGIKEGREEGIKEGREEGIKEGREEGIKEGREEGIKEGREEGIKEGREEGIKEKTNETIIAMLNKNMSLTDISDVTGMSIDYINSIKNNNKY